MKDNIKLQENYLRFADATLWCKNISYLEQVTHGYDHLARWFLCLYAKELVTSIRGAKDIAKSPGVCHVLGNEGDLMHWVVVETVLENK